MVKKIRESKPRLSEALSRQVIAALNCVELRMQENNILLRRLAEPTRAYSHGAMSRFHAWAAAELDRKNTGKSEIENMPDALRAVPAEQLTRWLSDDVRAFEAIKMSIEESLKLSGITAAAKEIGERRDISVRWPDARLP